MTNVDAVLVMDAICHCKVYRSSAQAEPCVYILNEEFGNRCFYRRCDYVAKSSFR